METPFNFSGKKVVIISDTHLTTDYDEKKYDALVTIMTKADVVILNGDFWDGFQVKYDNFIHSEWKNIFSLLLQKDTLYFYGNHDAKRYGSGADFSVNQFKQATLIQNGVMFNIEHGNRIDPTIDAKIPLPRFILSLGSKYEGYMVAKKGLEYLHAYDRENEIMRAWKKSHIPPEEWLICGHSHLAEIEYDEKFANSGICNWGVLQYLLLENGQISAESLYY